MVGASVARFAGGAYGHDRQGQVVAGAAGVASLEGVPAAGEGRSIGQVTERVKNRVGRGIVNHPKNCARSQRPGAGIDERKRHVAINGHA